MFAAAEAGHVTIVQRLLDVGADANMRAGDKHWTPLQIAQFNGGEKVIEVLTNFG